MPLKFLKKCRHYNVTSKRLFVISVLHLLDTSTTVDCTISSESKGQECLDNVCQRLNIQQPEFFGLRYVVEGKENEMKWIDLERTLSRQLEKYAAGNKIYLRVRHYVTSGVRHLSDDLTRYYCFLQLKSDIYDGKMTCDIRTAILLALYCRQTEYDSNQSDKQTKDYLRLTLVLPKNLQGLANDDNLLDSLIAEVLQQNDGIQHLTQSQAEEMYIQCCQQLDGYGEERFQAKDTLGNDLQLGLAINGMMVTAENGRQYFPWRDFHTVSIDKRVIKIEQNKADVSTVGSFQFAEAETARYFWTLCIAQHKFFKRYIDDDSGSLSGGGGAGNEVEEEAALPTTGSAFGYDFGDSRDDMLLEQQQRAIYTPGGGVLSPSTTASPFIASGDFVSAQSLHQQHLAPPHGGLVTGANASAAALMTSSNISLAASHQSGGALGQNWMNKDYAPDYISSQQQLAGGILDTRVQSSSCLDLSNNNLHSSSSTILLSHNNNNNNNHIIAADAHERERLKAMLPTYRPAPDYETAVQLKYRSPSIELQHSQSQSNHHQQQHHHNNLAAYHLAAAAAAGAMPAYYAGSQPDVHNAAAIYEGGALHLAAHRFPDVAQPAAALHANAHQHALQQQQQQQQQAQLPHHGGAYIDLVQRLALTRSKPPPPYPVNRLSSSSTPDLAVASHRPLIGVYRSYVSGSSPDLVSNRNNLLNTQYHHHYVGGAGTGTGMGVGMAGTAASNVSPPTAVAPAILHQYHAAAPSYMGGHSIGHSQQYLPHGTFENLNMIEEQPSIVSQLRQSALSQAAAVQAVGTSYEQHSPTLPPPATAYRPAPAPASVMSPHNGSIEPIYENVPLPPQYPPATVSPAMATAPTPTQRNSEQRSSGSSAHAGTSGGGGVETMRNRTSSIQSAPGGMPMPPVPAARHQHHHQHHPPPSANSTGIATAAVEHRFAHSERAASSDPLRFADSLPPPQRAMRGGSAAPTINVTEPPSSSSSKTVLDSSTLSQQLSAGLNISSSASSSLYNTTLDTTGTSSASNASSAKEGKRRRRWNILGRSKTPDKQRSATLGREKASSANTSSSSSAATGPGGKAKVTQDDLQLPHRWSTGVPKLQPISGQYSKDKLCQILDGKLNDPQLFMEFESIPKRREQARYDCALLAENAAKNFDPNFLPYDDNRVRITPTMENRHGYVNASHITATVGTKQRFYIVAQSPHGDLTTRIFWQCVWEADVYLIVQLSEELNYIPPNTNQRLEFGQFQVYQEFSQTTDRCITSKLRLFHIQSRRYRSVWHLNYVDWAEQNCPRDLNHFLDFLEELNSVRQASINEVPPGHNTNPPVLIHCLEGGGRSGVTLTADLLLYTLDHNEDLDIPRVIGQLRHQRDSIIPSLAQYKFVYGLLTTYLKRTRLI